MYKFFKDKQENFTCNIGIKGSSLSKTKARLILENEEYSLIFNGDIDSNGKCVIPVKKLKILSENLTGKLKFKIISKLLLRSICNDKFSRECKRS